MENSFYLEETDTGDLATIEIVSQLFEKMSKVCGAQHDLKELIKVLKEFGKELQSIKLTEAQEQITELVNATGAMILISEANKFTYSEKLRADAIISAYESDSKHTNTSKADILRKERIANMRIRKELTDKELIHYLNTKRHKEIIENQIISPFTYVDIQKAYGKKD